MQRLRVVVTGGFPAGQFDSYVGISFTYEPYYCHKQGPVKLHTVA
jgi:hypothetical protein